MNAKEYLGEIHKMRSKMISLKRREEELRTEAEGLRAIVYDKEKVQKSVANKFDSIMAELIEVQLQYAQAIEKCMKEIADREKKIAALSVGYAEILRWRYIECDEQGKQLSFEEIRKELHMSSASGARHRHMKALNAFSARYKVDTQSHTHL